MRLKYYKLSLRQMKFNKSFVLFFLIIILVVSISAIVINNKIKPTIKTLCESKAKALALNKTNEIVSEYMKNISYSSLIDLKENEQGKIIAMTANVTEMNRLTSNISSDVQQNLSNMDNVYIKVPLGTMLNVGMFSGYGPNISIKVVPAGNVTAKFNSEFEQAGINQTRHRIFLQIVTKVKIVAPFYTDTQEYTNEINVAETIIVGDTPSSYYYINGLELQDSIGLN